MVSQVKSNCISLETTYFCMHLHTQTHKSQLSPRLASSLESPVKPYSEFRILSRIASTSLRSKWPHQPAPLFFILVLLSQYFSFIGMCRHNAETCDGTNGSAHHQSEAARHAFMYSPPSHSHNCVSVICFVVALRGSVELPTEANPLPLPQKPLLPPLQCQNVHVPSPAWARPSYSSHAWTNLWERLSKPTTIQPHICPPSTSNPLLVELHHPLVIFYKIHQTRLIFKC